MRICIVTRPSHPSLIGGSLLHTQALTLFHSKRARDVTALLYALNRFALRLADQSKVSPGFAGWDRLAKGGIRRVCSWEKLWS